jgi:2-desacetyl-2-hydroxyethyl bacteriochlorophyllide A dehydrogenase
MAIRSLCLRQPGLLEFQSDPEPPAPDDDQALVAVRAIGICGTDLSGYLGKMPFIQYPRILGHELGVEVLQVGNNVTTVQPGNRCSVEPYLHCGSCEPCRLGRTNCCENLKVLGVHCDGGMRQRLIVHADKLHRSKQLDFDQLALVETLAIGSHAVQRAELTTRDRILIIGAGPIGLATLEFALLKSDAVTVIEPNEERRVFITHHYPSVKIPSGPPLGSSFSAVFDATGNAQSMSASLQYAAFGARIVFVGITTEPVILDDPLFHRRELTLLASRNALSSDFPKIIKLIESRQIEIGKWISQRAPFDSAPDVFAQITNGTVRPIKTVLILPGQE